MFPFVAIMLAVYLGFLPTSSALGELVHHTRNSSGCLTSFRTKPAHFEPCKSNICFLFVAEIPYVILDPRMVTENNQTIFRCKDRARHFPDLRGITFAIKDALELDDAFCVYAGNQCSFDGMIDFVAENSSPSERYRFAVTGLAQLLPHRISLHTRPSMPITGERIVLLGSRTLPSLKTDASNIEKSPFPAIGTVAVVFSFLCWVLSDPFSLEDTTGDQGSSRAASATSKLTQALGKLAEVMRLWSMLGFVFLRRARVVFMALICAYLGYSLAIHRLEHYREAISSDLQVLPQSKLNEFVVPFGGALDFIFRRTVDPDGNYRERSAPWHYCVNVNDCYDKILDKSHPAKYFVAYDSPVRYMLHKKNACDKWAVHNTRSALNVLSGVWYFSSNVPRDVRHSVDRAIVTLILEGKMEAIISSVVGDSMTMHCGEQHQIRVVDVSPMIVLVAVTPLLTVVVSTLICIHIYRWKLQPDSGSIRSRLKHKCDFGKATWDRPQNENVAKGTRIGPAVLMDLLSLTETERSNRIVSILDAETAAGPKWGNVAKFSSRFSAAWAEIEGRNAAVWFCIMDGEHSVFVLQSISSVPPGKIEGYTVGLRRKRIPINCLNIPVETVSWSTLLQSAVDFTESDNTVRAVLVACLISAYDASGISCVYDALVPKSLASLSTRIEFDIPVDVDLMTTFADPLHMRGQLYFKCGIGTMARAVGQANGICHLKRETVHEQVPQSDLEQVGDRLPILYGYGKFLHVEPDAPCTTSQVGHIVDMLPSQGSVSKLLWAIISVADNLHSAGNLDLSAAAGVIFDTHGAFLGAGPKRRIKGDILIVGKDGIYKSSRFRKLALEGSCEVNLAILKLGLKVGPQVDTTQDKRIDNLSQIAEHILGREYKFQYFDNRNENAVLGPCDLWSNETAVCNSLVALVCRKYGRFTGFSAVASTPASIRVPQSVTMQANIFLPSLSVWEHPHSYMLRHMPRRLKTFFVRVLTCSYSEKQAGPRFILTMIWNVIVACMASWNHWPDKYVRSLIMDYWAPSTSRVHEFCFRNHRIIAYPGPRMLFNKPTTGDVIEIAADVFNDT